MGRKSQGTGLPRPDAGPRVAFGGPGSERTGNCTILSAPRTYNRVGGGTWSTLGLTARYSTTEARDNPEESSETLRVVLWVPMRNVHRDESFNCVQGTPATVPAGVFIDGGQRVTPADDPWRGWSGFNAIATPLDGCGENAIPELVSGSDYRSDAITNYLAQDAAGAFSKCQNEGAPGAGGGGGGGTGSTCLGCDASGTGNRAIRRADGAQLSPWASEQLATVQGLIERRQLAELGVRAPTGVAMAHPNW